MDKQIAFEPYDPKVVLAVGAHADDIDVMAGGSIARWAANGAEVHYLILTDGSKGSNDESIATEQLIATRQNEQREAGVLLGAREVHFLNYEDGALELTMALKGDIVRVVRQIQPDTVVVMDPSQIYSAKLGIINHADHRAAGQATLDAVYPLARDYLSFPELGKEGLAAHKVAHLLLTNYETENYFVDISNTFDKKLEALAKHASQFGDMSGFGDMLRQRAAALGSKTGSAYAEGFIRVDLRT